MLKILRRLTKDDIFKNENGLYGLFLNFPFKDFQQRAQQLERGLLSDFFIYDLRAKTRKKTAWCFEVVDEKKSLALFVVEPSEEQSKIYGKKMFKISTVINYLNFKPCFDLFWCELTKIIRGQKIKYLSCRLDASDYKNIALFASKGFQYAGVSMKAILPLKSHLLLLRNQSGDLSVEVAKFANLSRILKIARQHRHNHVVYDAFLNKNKAGELFSRRVRDFSKKSEYRIYEIKRDNEVIGFANYVEPVLFNRAMHKKIITLDLVVIDDKYRGKNFGFYLLAKSLINEAKIGFEEVELRVASDNYLALNFYIGFGFRIVGSDIWLSYGPKQ